MLICKEFTFDSAHHLVAYKGKCENVHGHTYKLRVCVEEDVKEDGLGIDFTILKKIVNEKVIEVLDHNDLNNILDQPSCELIAIWIWDVLKQDLNMTEIWLWESPGSYVVYKGENS